MSAPPRPTNPTSLGALFFEQARRNGARPLLHHRAADACVGSRGWKQISWQAAAQYVRSLARALVELGLQRGERVAILSENRPEWLLADLACLTLGLIDVPIYATNPRSEVEPLLARSGARALFVSSEDQWRKVAPCRARLPRLAHVLSFDAIEGEGAPLSTAELVRRHASGDDAAIDARLAAVGREDLATVLYTSGTTGEPKGVMLTHGNLLANCEAILAHINVGPSDRTLSFLPLSHSFERTAGHYCLLMAGGEIAYATGHEKVPVEIKEMRPTLLLGVPRFYEKVEARIRAVLERGSRFHRALVRFARPLVLKRLRQRLGGRLRFFVSGGAPLDAEIVRFFGDLGIPLLEGYGLTETSPVVACNRPGRVKAGSVGEILPGVTVTIASDGEVLVRGPSVMRGYLDQPDATAQVLEPDGTFHTGDVGHLDDEGFLFITDRKKDLIVESGGKKVAPAHVEALLKRQRAVGDICLIGDRRPYLVALIVPDDAALKLVVQERGDTWTSRAAMLAQPFVREIFQRAVTAANADLAPPERVRRFALLPEPFTIDNHELTPTLKVRRKVVESRYQLLIDQLYAATPGQVDGIPILAPA